MLSSYPFRLWYITIRKSYLLRIYGLDFGTYTGFWGYPGTLGRLYSELHENHRWSDNSFWITWYILFHNEFDSWTVRYTIVFSFNNTIIVIMINNSIIVLIIGSYIRLLLHLFIQASRIYNSVLIIFNMFVLSISLLFCPSSHFDF